jgi:hypothetical protein
MSDESSIGGISQYSVEDESEVQSLLNDIELNKMLLEKAKSVKDMPDSSLARPHFCSTSFSKKYPELGLKLYHDYKLPFELSDKQFHELVFSKLHLNNDSKFEVARILIEKLMELNPEQREKFERFYSRGSNFNHILAGIASKYLPEDIVEFCLSVNFSQAFTKTPSYTEDCRLTSRLLDEVFDRFGTENVAWSPSHNTCKQILEALEKNKNFVHH